MSSKNGTPTMHHVPTSSPWLNKLGAVKLDATKAKEAKPLPTADDAGIIHNGNVAYWRDGDVLMIAIAIDDTTRELSPRPIVAKTGKPSKTRTVAKVGEFSRAVELGEGLRLTLWLGDGN